MTVDFLEVSHSDAMLQSAFSNSTLAFKCSTTLWLPVTSGPGKEFLEAVYLYIP